MSTSKGSSIRGRSNSIDGATAAQPLSGLQGFRRRRAAKGFTLIELVVTLAVLGVALALAIPTYENVNQRRQTTAKAEKIAAFIAYVQSEAVKQNQAFSVALQYTNANDWCVGAHEGAAACDCNETDAGQADFCAIDGEPMILDSDTDTKSGMVDPSTISGNDTSFAFDPVRGILDTADLGSVHTFLMESDNANWQLRVDLSASGRVRVCNDDENKEVPGFDLCTVVQTVPEIEIVDPPPFF